MTSKKENSKPEHPKVKKKCCGKTMHVISVNVKDGVKTQIEQCPSCCQRDTTSITK